VSAENGKELSRSHNYVSKCHERTTRRPEGEAFSKIRACFRIRECQKYSAESIAALWLFAIVTLMRDKIEETPQERTERLKAFAAQLQVMTDCPLMREKIAAILSGVRVDH
jgi:hypothetical protein